MVKYFNIGIGQSFFFVWILIVIDAIPWPLIFGDSGEVNEYEGRIPELDEYLKKNAALLANPEDHPKLVREAITLAKEYKMDPESAKYYLDLLMRIEKEGLNTIKLEREKVNKKMAFVFTNAVTHDQMTHVMKQRHILDAFIDAASEVAWPWIKGTAKPISSNEEL